MIQSDPKMKKSDQFIVRTDDAGLRLDVFVSKMMPQITRSHAKKLVDDGHVLVNGLPKKTSYLLKAGEKISVEEVAPGKLDLEAQELPLDILYEDGDVVVVNKAAGMVVHPGAGVSKGTLVNALLAHCKDLSGIGGVERPGIVHRLDKGTSGVIIVAKNDRSHQSLSKQFKDRTVEKHYLALAYGRLPAEHGIIDAPIGRHGSHRQKMSTKTNRGRASVTEWKVVERFGNHFTLLDINLHTGRTHQIRVHLSSIGHALVGDVLYGGKKVAKRVTDDKLQGIISLIERPMLHSASIAFDLPGSNKRVVLKAPLPDDINNLIKDLRKASE